MSRRRSHGRSLIAPTTSLTLPRALLLTVDSNVGDLRQAVEKMKGSTGSAEPGKKMGAFDVFEDSPHDPRLNWNDLKWLKGIAGEVPIYLKGVSSIEVRCYAVPAGACC